MENTVVYVTILLDSLKKKVKILKKIFELTKEQNSILSEKNIEKVDAEAFDDIVDKKAILLEKMQELDDGFDTIYKKVCVFFSENKEEYKPQILEMQNLIRVITEIGVQIQHLEMQNKTKFNTFIRNKRHAINDFKQSNRVATSYYQNMSNQHREWQSHFLDQKK